MARSKKPKLLDAAALFDYAVAALSARALTQGELRVRLQRRAADPADVEPILARLKEYGYLDDRRFAETFTRLRLENQGWGRFRVLRDLKNRRIAPQLADKVVRDAYRGVDEEELIERQLARRWRGQAAGALTPSRLASLYRSLLRAGFSPGGVARALRKLSVPPEWVDSLESGTGDEPAGS